MDYVAQHMDGVALRQTIAEPGVGKDLAGLPLLLLSAAPAPRAPLDNAVPNMDIAEPRQNTAELDVKQAALLLHHQALPHRPLPRPHLVRGQTDL